jgi:lipopolysaccharide transport system ATP-binding protein
LSITVSHLSKRFRLYARPWRRFQEWASLGALRRHVEYWALRDVSFEVPDGAAIGIVGENGAGKSTLLKIITGTLFPTEGSVRVRGRVAALLELGTGFHPEFTGRTNIQLNGKMLGLSDAEIEERTPEIIRFSELGDFIDQPLRTYSSGMEMRLGFAIATCVDPDVLIIDEALSVGDAYFSQKCVRRIREFRERGVTILFVSHDPGAVLTLCDRALLLENGRLEREGSPEEVLSWYNARLARKSERGGSPILFRRDESGGFTQRSGNFRALLTETRILNAKGEATDRLVAGETARVEVGLLFPSPVQSPTVGILIRNRLGVEAFGVNTHGLKRDLGNFEAGQTARVCFEFPLNLGPGDYSLTVAAHLEATHLTENFDWIDRALVFRVLPAADYPFLGVARLEPRLEVERGSLDEAGVTRALEAVFADLAGEGASADGSPVLFLDGWNAPAEGSVGDENRWLLSDRPARFVGRPLAQKLRAGFFSPAPDVSQISAESPLPRLRLSWPGGNVEAVWRDRLEAVFELPASLPGSARIFEITMEGGHKPLRLALLRTAE